jgi:hypothetical protein
MIDSIRDFLGDISGYRPLYLSALAELQDAREARERLTAELNEAKEKIRQLELLLPRPAPQPITYVVEKDSLWLQHEIDSMQLGIIRFVLDGKYRLTNQANFLNVVAWDWTDRLPYIKERFDCENFAILFKAVVDLYFELNQVAVILDYESGHGYNLVVYPDGNKSVLEPQSDGLYIWTKRCQTFYSLQGAIALI